MNKIALIAGLAVAATGASADVLLTVDLSVANQVTISSTAGNASVSAASTTFTGFLMAGFYNDAANTVSDLSVSGNLSTANEASDNSADLFSGSTSFGLNIWSFSGSAPTVTAGSQAFSGSTTWTLSAADYAEMLAGNSSGSVYMNADDDGDIVSGAGVEIGTWAYVPAPSSMALLGLGGIVAGRRRR